MRAGSDSGTAVGSRQTDWQGRGQTFSFPPSEALLPQISISIKPRLLPGDTRSRGLGGRSRGSSLPPVVSVKRRVVMPPRCLPSAALDSPHLRGAARGFCRQLDSFSRPGCPARARDGATVSSPHPKMQLIYAQKKNIQRSRTSSRSISEASKKRRCTSDRLQVHVAPPTLRHCANRITPNRKSNAHGVR